jgi:hypothetical protein
MAYKKLIINFNWKTKILKYATVHFFKHHKITAGILIIIIGILIQLAGFLINAVILIFNTGGNIT